MDLPTHRQQVVRALTALEASIARLTDALAHDDVTIEVEPATDPRSPIRRVCEAYSAIDYRMDDEVGTSVVCLGVLGVSTDLLRRAEALHAAAGNQNSHPCQRRRITYQSHPGAARDPAQHPAQRRQPARRLSQNPDP